MNLVGKRIVAIGEVVWDVFTDRQVLGGAPVNVAYHLSCLGLPVLVVSRVGDDALGEETLDLLGELGVDIQAIQKDSDLVTGQVKISVDHNNEPRFDIVAPAAWDNIDLEKAVKKAGDDFCLLFGTLAQRDLRARDAIRSLWEKATYCFYDVNLRPPFTSQSLVIESLAAADMVKLNEEELLQVGDWLALDHFDQHEVARNIKHQFGIDVIAVTMGKRGAWLLADNKIFTCTAETIKVRDTVGAGDAFFAALIAGFVSETPWPENLKIANLRGGYVASQSGATPPMPSK